jgi:hypothetical protein
MKNLLQQILDWSEAWAPVIPLVILVLVKPRDKWVLPIKIYLFAALLVNLAATLVWMRYIVGLEPWLYKNFSFLYNRDKSLDNTLLYNIHSVSRFILFAWFFSFTRPVFGRINKLVVPVFMLTCLVFFIFYADFRDFNSLLLSTEAALLLFYCLVYYFILLREEELSFKLATSWVVTGLGVYVVVNFPIFLFYSVLAQKFEKFAVDIWDLHNLTFILLCIFIAIAFYKSGKMKTPVIFRSR